MVREESVGRPGQYRPSARPLWRRESVFTSPRALAHSLLLFFFAGPTFHRPAPSPPRRVGAVPGHEAARWRRRSGQALRRMRPLASGARPRPAAAQLAPTRGRSWRRRACRPPGPGAARRGSWRESRRERGARGRASGAFRRCGAGVVPRPLLATIPLSHSFFSPPSPSRTHHASPPPRPLPPPGPGHPGPPHPGPGDRAPTHDGGARPDDGGARCDDRPARRALHPHPHARRGRGGGPAGRDARGRAPGHFGADSWADRGPGKEEGEREREGGGAVAAVAAVGQPSPGTPWDPLALVSLHLLLLLTCELWNPRFSHPRPPTASSARARPPLSRTARAATSWPPWSAGRPPAARCKRPPSPSCGPRPRTSP